MNRFRRLGSRAMDSGSGPTGCVNVVPLVALLIAACVGSPSGAPASSEHLTAFVGGRVLPSPEENAIPDGVVLVEGATIRFVGPRATVQVPAGAEVIDCSGATVTAGFWNSHVHLRAAVFPAAETAPSDALGSALRAMLTSHGVVHAVDLGSNLSNTLALRRRIESGEIPGPAILTAGSGFAPAGGSPYYILPGKLPELAQPSDAGLVEYDLARGADVVKLYTGSWATPGSIVVMPVGVVRAAVEVGHRHGKLVFAHPSNSPGARAAIEGGVDVLAHTFPSSLDGSPWDQTLPEMMKARGMALIPTLKVWPYEMKRAGRSADRIDRILATGIAQTRAFVQLGGELLFGTDVGYMTDFDPSEEFVYLQRAGLGTAQILAMLTTAPAARFGQARRGRLRPGFAADVVVLDGDPASDVRVFGRARTTMRDGRIIYSRVLP